MACGCNIAAHDNLFNKAILGTDASYFSTADDVKKVINQPLQQDVTSRFCHHNVEKIRTIYNWNRIINDYEAIFLQVLLEK